MSDLPPGFVLDGAPQAPGGLPAGFALDPMQSAPPPNYWNMAKDAAMSFGTGLANGAIGMAGLPGDFKNAVNRGLDKIMPLPPEAQQSQSNLLPSSHQISSAVQGVTGDFHQPQTTAGKYAESIGEMAPAVFTGPGGMVRKSLQAIGSGVGAQAAGDLAQGTGYEPLARVAGTLAGGYAPNLASRIVTPLPISQQRQQALSTLAQEGVTGLTAGQKTGNIPLRYAESIFGDAPFAGAKASDLQEQGLRQFTQAATRRAGINGLATPQELQTNYDRLGNEFQQLSSRNALKFDPQFAQDLNSAYGIYHNVMPGSQQKAIVDGYVNDILSHAQAGQTMPGSAYQTMRSRLSAQAQAMSASDPTTAGALKGIRDALDSAMARSISPQDAAAWDTARQQYGAQKVLQQAASRTGQSAAEGYITPQALRTAVATGKTNAGAYARGQGQFADLARAGNVAMTPLPNSGTAQRWMELGSGAFGLDQLIHGGITPTSAAIAAGTIAGPGITGRALFSKPVQSYLSNQMVAAPTAVASKHAQIARIANALAEAARRSIPH